MYIEILFPDHVNASQSIQF